MKTHVIAPMLRLNPPDALPGELARRAAGSKGDKDTWMNRYSAHPGYNLNPRRLVSIFREAECGYPARQCDLFEDIIESDGHLRSQLETRLDSVAGKEWIIQAGGDTEEDWEAATLLEDELRQMGSFTEMLEHQLTAPWYGWAATEVIWTDEPKNPELTVAPTWFANWPHRRVVFDDRDDPRVVVRMAEHDGEPLEPGRWLFSKRRHRLTAMAGLMRTAAWWSFFKRMNVADWVAFAGRFGFPLPIGKYRDDMPEPEKEALKQAVAMIGKDGYAVFSEGGSIELIKVDYGGSQEIHPMLANFCNAEISKLVTGATLTSGEGTSTGSYALGAVHENVAFNIVMSDAKRLGDWFQMQVGLPFCQWNGLSGRPPRLKINVVRELDPPARMAAMCAYVNELGGTLDADQVRQEFNFKDPVGAALTGKAVPAPMPGAPAPAGPETPPDAGGEPPEDDAAAALRANAPNKLGSPDQPRDEDGKWGDGGGGGGPSGKKDGGGAPVAPASEKEAKETAKLAKNVENRKARLEAQEQRIKESGDDEEAIQNELAAHRAQYSAYDQAVVEDRVLLDQPEIKSYYDSNTYQVGRGDGGEGETAAAEVHELRTELATKGIGLEVVNTSKGRTRLEDWEGHVMAAEKKWPDWLKTADDIDTEQQTARYYAGGRKKFG